MFFQAFVLSWSNNTENKRDDYICDEIIALQVIGMHFFAPAHVMRLLENVRGCKTSQQTIATAMKLGERMKKVTVRK